MRHQVNQRLLRPQAPRLRGAFMMFFMFVYVFIGLAHATTHVNEVIAHANGAILATISLETSGAATDHSDDADSKKSSAVAEYCQVYAPSAMPVLAFVAVPLARPIDLLFVTPAFLAQAALRLDTPPPRHLT